MEIVPAKPSVKGPPERFVGEVWIDTIAEGRDGSQLGVAAVRFSPGACNAWHSHSRGQTLYVTEGEGRVQARGEAPIPLRAGDIVYTPPDEWHWHGATPERGMTHLSIVEGETMWGEHVNDGDYPADDGPHVFLD